MPPRRGVRRSSRASLGKGSDLMGPPPAPSTVVQPSASAAGADSKAEQQVDEDALAQKTFGWEVKALRECLIAAATTMAQLVNHHTDIHKIGVERYAPYPPRGLREAWIGHTKRYDDIIDSIEIQVQRTLAAVEYQIEQENEKLRVKEELQKAPSSSRGRKPSMSIDIPKFSEASIDPLTIHPELTLTSKSPEELPDTIMQDGGPLSEEPTAGMDGPSDDAKAPLGAVPSGAAVPKESAISRTSRSSISLTSLNRHGLKLDLSSLTLDGLSENKSSIAGPRPSALGAAAMSGIEAIASPVTLAPKSARPRAGYEGEFPNLDIFLNSAIDGIQLPSGDTGAGIEVPPGDINMDDLFGDNEMGFSASGEGGNSIAVNPTSTAMGPLFSPEDMLPVKTEEIPINLDGPGAMSHEDKLFEELGFVEVPGNAMASTSASVQPNLSLDNVIGSFDFSVAPDNALSNDFNLMQQRQQFGLDLNLTATSSGQAGQAESSTVLPDFSFWPSSAGVDGDLNFDIFNQPASTDSKTNQTS